MANMILYDFYYMCGINRISFYFACILITGFL